MRKLLVPLLLATVPVLFAAGLASPASAAETAGAATINGGGSISPGLTNVPTAQAVSFSGNARGAGVLRDAAGTVVTGQYELACTFNGSSSILETDGIGGGTATGTCAGTGNGVKRDATGTVTPLINATGSVACDVSYVRAAAVVVVTGNCSFTLASVTGMVNIVSELLFVPNNVNPTTSYQLAGVQQFFVR